MKRMMAIALLGLAGFIAAGNADAHGQNPRYQTIEYVNFQQRGACNINGVVYPVAMDYSVWGPDAYNNWVPIGGVTWLRYNIWLFQDNYGDRLEVTCW
jgi:hypothetical protein